MLTLKKVETTYVMRNLPLYVPKKGTYMTVELKDEETFQHHKKKLLLLGD